MVTTTLHPSDEDPSPGAPADGGDGGQGGAVENDYGVAAAVGDVAEFAGGVERDAVSAVEVGDGADELTGMGINHIDAVAVGEIEAMGRRIGEQAIPAAVAADFPAVEDFVGLLGGEQGWGGEKAAQQGRGCEGPGEKTKAGLVGHGRLRVEVERSKDTTLRWLWRDGRAGPASGPDALPS